MRQFFAYAWKLLLLRGILAVLFALVAIFLPAIAFSTLILLFGAWLIINGILTIIGSIQSRKEDRNWWIAMLTGLVGLLLGIYTYANPIVTAATIMILIGIWSILFGIAEVIFAIRIRKMIEGEGWLIAGGIISVIFGLLLLANPIQGGITLTLLLGVYALIMGLFFIMLGLRVRRMANNR